MQIIFLDKVDSTHMYLKEYTNQNGYKNPLCVASKHQTNGIGSRGNNWIGKKGNWFFSFVIDKNLLPQDLSLQSASIYFSYLLKQVLQKEGSSLWVKWPNDFYIEDKKVGGTITTLKGDLVYCGIGLNVLEVSQNFGFLDINMDFVEILEKYFKNLEKLIPWKNIFSDFKIEFQKSKFFNSTIGEEKVSLKDAILNEDGSVSFGKERVFSLR